MPEPEPWRDGADADYPSGEALLRAFPGVAVVVDTDRRVRDWNDRAASVLGLDDGAPGLDGLVRPAHRERVRAAVTEAVETGGSTVVVDLPDGDDTGRYELDCSSVGDAEHPAGVLVTGRRVADGERTATETPAGADADPLHHTGLVEALGDGAYAVDGEREVLAVTDRLAATLGRDRADLVGRPFRDLVADEDVPAVVGLHEALLAGDRDEGSADLRVRTGDGDLPVELHAVAVPGDVPGGDRAAVGVVRDRSDRRRREQQLARHRDQLATLNRISEAVSEVVQGIVDSATREGIEATVCERLADSDLYRTVWVGRSGAGELEPTTTAGAPPEFHERPSTASDEVAYERPAERALRTGEPCVRRAERIGETAPPAVRQLAVEYGIRASMGLPITHGGATYGVLCLYSPRADAFTERERAALERLARVVGFAINAADTEQLLHSGAVTELVFRVRDDCFLAALSVAGSVDLRWTVPEDGGLRHYLEVAATADRAVAAAEAAGAADVAVVSERGDDGGDRAPLTIVEARPADSVAGRLADAGAVVHSAGAADGVAEFTARIADSTDTRTVVEAFLGSYDATLAAKRRVEDPVRTASDLRRVAGERLTERQADVLRTAYLMGYFEWPREQNAEEVADRMDITSATLHYHLRAAQRGLLEVYFEESPTGG